MSTPDASAADVAPVPQHAAAELRRLNEHGGTIGSAIVRAIQVLRRERFENEAQNLESALMDLPLMIERLITTPDLLDVPEHLRDGLAAYVSDGRPTGGFLFAVLSNDLADAVSRADATSLRGLKALVNYLRSPRVPPQCWGSAERVRAWFDMPQRKREQLVAQHAAIESGEQS